LDAAVVVDKPNVFVDAVREWTNGQGVNVILDLVGGAYFEANVSALAPKGRLMLVGTTAGSQATLDFSTVMRKRLRIIGTVLRTRSAEEKAAATRLFVNHVVPLLASGAVQPTIDSTYSLDEIREAHARLESNKTFGKVVLMLGQ
jgi:NADPH:quinone reductase-like Zn-dependent oxidoreductase